MTRPLQDADYRVLDTMLALDAVAPRSLTTQQLAQQCHLDHRTTRSHLYALCARGLAQRTIDAKPGPSGTRAEYASTIHTRPKGTP